jgi:hypothetical protein
LFGLLIVSTIYSGGSPERNIYNDHFYNDVSEIHTRSRIQTGSGMVNYYIYWGHGLYLLYQYNRSHLIERYSVPIDRETLIPISRLALLCYNLNHNTNRKDVRLKEVSSIMFPYNITHSTNTMVIEYDRYTVPEDGKIDNVVEILDETALQNKETWGKSKIILTYNSHDKLISSKEETIIYEHNSAESYREYDFLYDENNELQYIYCDLSGEKFLEMEFFCNRRIDPLVFINFDNFIPNHRNKIEPEKNIIIIENDLLKYSLKLASNKSHEIQPHHTLFEYNETGDIIREMQYWRDGGIGRIITEPIEYDEKNNWVYLKEMVLYKSDPEGNNPMIYEWDRKILYK